MYGLEKGQKPKKMFEYDLEIDLKKNSKKANDTIAQIDNRIHECKDQIKKGTSSKDLDNWTVLFNGYSACKRVLQTSLNIK